MNFQSTSMGRSAQTFTTHREVSQAHGQTGSQKKSRSAMAPVYPPLHGIDPTTLQGSGRFGRRGEVRAVAMADDGDSDGGGVVRVLPHRGDGFAAFYFETQPEMVRVATLLVRSSDVALDLVQDCFVRIHARWDRIDDPPAYLRRSVANACHSHHRRERRLRALRLRPADPVELGADELGDALAALPDRQRQAVVLRFYAGLPDADIAAALGCRVGTVASLIHRGLAALREVLEP
jgi:RNA polymerase sigma-70 factor (sigma-E family)